MAREINKLSARFVATCTKSGRHADGGGLYLSISPDGTRKRWVFMYARNGRQRELGLGPLSDVALVSARKKAEEARRQLADGVDPIEARRAVQAPSTVPTFGATAEEYITSHEAAWRNPKHVAQWRMTLSVQKDGHGDWIENGYCASLRNKPVNEIDTASVLGVLKTVWQAKPETASRLRGRIEAVLDAAKVAGHRDGPNPAQWKGHLEHLLPARKKEDRGSHAAMPFADVPAFVGKLRLARGMGAFALEFAILTAARSGEVRLARWGEVDLDNKLWIVPAERMKAGREHRVPLSDRAAEILRIVLPLRPIEGGKGALIFPSSRRERPLSDMTLAAAMNRLGAGDFTPHGFRSSFRDWAGDATTFPREIAEAALAHSVGDKVELAYRRGDALEKRRKMMEAWARFVEPKLAANILPMARGAR